MQSIVACSAVISIDLEIPFFPLLKPAAAEEPMTGKPSRKLSYHSFENLRFDSLLTKNLRKDDSSQAIGAFRKILLYLSNNSPHVKGQYHDSPASRYQNSSQRQYFRTTKSFLSLQALNSAPEVIANKFLKDTSAGLPYSVQIRTPWQLRDGESTA